MTTGRGRSRRGSVVAATTFTAIGGVLSAAYFPMMFNRFAPYDDEGLFLVSLREFLKHGSLYVHTWGDKYGPFYYSVMGALYRITGQRPTLSNGRVLVLIITAASAAVFAAAVWRVTRSLPAGILCEVAAFLILIHSAGYEPMHPGALGVLVLAVAAYALAGYAVEHRESSIFVVGLATGALIMIKINVGFLLLVAVVAALVVERSDERPRIRSTIAVLAIIAPFVLVFQNVAEVWGFGFALLVGGTIAGVIATTSADRLPLPRRAIAVFAVGVIVATVASSVWPLLTGTSPSALFSGVVTKSFTQGTGNTPPGVAVSWIAVVVTLAGIYYALAVRSRPGPPSPDAVLWRSAALASTGLVLIGTGVVSVYLYSTANWLPAIALLPALALTTGAAEGTRQALRWLVLVAVFQILVAYPLAGSQVAWGTVAMTVPCAIAVAAGIDRLDVWRATGPAKQFAIVALFSVLLVLPSGMWPVTAWQGYLRDPKLELPGAGLLHLIPDVGQNPDSTVDLQLVTKSLRAACDTFYVESGPNSFYIFAGVEPPSGLVANFPAALDESQQEEVVARLRAAEANHQRVCIVRDAVRSTPASYRTGPLYEYTKDFHKGMWLQGSLTVDARNDRSAQKRAEVSQSHIGVDR